MIQPSRRFSLGKLDRYTKTTAGKDTLINDKVNGANYKFYIDQATPPDL